MLHERSTHETCLGSIHETCLDAPRLLKGGLADYKLTGDPESMSLKCKSPK